VVTDEQQRAERASDEQKPTTAPSSISNNNSNDASPSIVKVPEIKSEPAKPKSEPAPKREPEREPPTARDAEESEPYVEPAEPEPTPQSEEETRNKVRLLRRAAIDAEVAHDYEKAVRLYEQIKKFPRDKWPLDLEVRLDNARKQLE
jgi:hypothetical protein